MSATQGEIGFGTLIKIGNGASPEVFTTIGELFDIGPVGETRALTEFTHHQSPNKRREWKGQLADGDEITCQCNYLPAFGDAGQAAVKAAASGVAVNFKVVGPADSTPADQVASFSALVTHYDVERPLDERMVFNFSVKITGPITYGAT